MMYNLANKADMLIKGNRTGQSAISTIWKEVNHLVSRLEWQHNRLLWVLLLSDCIFIIFHVVHRLDFYFLHSTIAFFKDPLLNITTEGNYSDFAQFGKELGCLFLLLWIAFHRREWGFFVWALLFCYLFLDDLLEIHEILGQSATDFFAFHPLLGIEPDGPGQALVSFAVGVPLILGLLVAFFGNSADFRSFCLQMGFVLAALAFCGVALDMIHIGNQTLFIRGLVSISEDGGELVVMSVAVALALAWCRDSTSSFPTP